MRIQEMSIRYQLVLMNIVVVLLVLVISGITTNVLVKKTVEKRIINDLDTSTHAIQKMVDTALGFSIQHHLRGIGQKNIDILYALNQDVLTGRLSMADARALGEKILLSQRIGKTGYIYALTGRGVLDVHPSPGLKGSDISDRWLFKKQVIMKQGFVEYQWKNPEETEERAKILYMEYFEPWDWIVSVSSYREEFFTLLDISDIRQDILSLELPHSGSAFILDTDGRFLVHSKYDGDLTQVPDASRWKMLFSRMAEEKNGSTRILWRDDLNYPAREKHFFYHYVDDLGWYIVSSAYSGDIVSELKEIHQIILLTAGIVLLVVIPVSLFIGNSLSKPLRKLSELMKKTGAGIFNIRADVRGSGEIRSLSRHFNGYMDRLANAHNDLSREMSERIRTAEQLKIFKKVFDNALEGISITDADGTIVTVNQAFSEITGYSREEAVGENPRILKSKKHDDAFYARMWQQLIEKGNWAGEIWNRRKNGEAYPEILNISSIKKPDGTISNYVAVFHDISEMKSQQAAIEHQAYHDALTGLPNRYLAHDRLSMALKRARRQESQVAVIFIDMDNFKYFNDSIGHTSGDILLQSLGGRLRKIVREQDTVARLGGDEFLIIVVDVGAQQQVLEMVNRLFECLKEPFNIDGHEILVSLSLGIALYPDDGRDADVLIKNADMAMYQSKAAGKNTYNMFTPELNQMARFKMELIKEFRAGLKAREFTVYYQPKVSPSTHAVKGVEALVRWQKTDGTLVSPADFIPMAEETGLIIDLGRYVLEESCRAVRVLQKAGADLTMAVNLSPLEFKQPDIVSHIEFALDQYGISPASLEVEITETTMMTDLEQTVEKLTILKDKGVSVAIDDFGTGYSSLYYLKKLPISTLKIDRSFINDIADDPGDAQIVETIVLMARNLGISVVAEGVETQTQLDLLNAYDCELVQGYFYAKPMPLEALLDYLSTG